MKDRRRLRVRRQTRCAPRNPGLIARFECHSSSACGHSIPVAPPSQVARHDESVPSRAAVPDRGDRSILVPASGLSSNANHQQNIPVEIDRSLCSGNGFATKSDAAILSVARLLDAKSYLWYYHTMSVAKVAVSIDDRLLRRLDSLVEREVFRSRSEAIQKAVAEKLARMDRGRLARECAKLLPGEEQQLAEEGIEKDASEWPEY